MESWFRPIQAMTMPVDARQSAASSPTCCRRVRRHGGAANAPTPAASFIAAYSHLVRGQRTLQRGSASRGLRRRAPSVMTCSMGCQHRRPIITSCLMLARCISPRRARRVKQYRQRNSFPGLWHRRPHGEPPAHYASNQGLRGSSDAVRESCRHFLAYGFRPLPSDGHRAGIDISPKSNDAGHR